MFYVVHCVITILLLLHAMPKAEIGSGVWGTPANFNGFRVLATLLHGTLVVGVSQTLRRTLNRGRHLYLAGWPSRWALAHILVLHTFQRHIGQEGFWFISTDNNWCILGISTHQYLYLLEPCTEINNGSLFFWQSEWSDWNAWSLKSYTRQQAYSPSSIMNLDRLADTARRPFWRPSWNLPLPAILFHPENDFNGFLDP